MLEYYAKGSELLCILCLDRKLEPVPEPFRLQGSVLLRVLYREYADFIQSLPTDMESIRISGDLSVTREFARIRSPLLYNCFLRDMAFAIAKELHYAEQYQRAGTTILPTSYMADTVSYTKICMVTSQCSDVARQLSMVAESYDFPLPIRVSEQNIALYRLAVYLLYISKTPGIQECNFQLRSN